MVFNELTQSWGFVDTSYSVDNLPETITSDVLTERQDVTSGGNDAWGGWFKEIASTAIDYAIKRDAAMVGAELRTAVPTNYAGTPYRTVQAMPGINPLWLIGGLVAVVLLVQK